MGDSFAHTEDAWCVFQPAGLPETEYPAEVSDDEKTVCLTRPANALTAASVTREVLVTASVAF